MAAAKRGKEGKEEQPRSSRSYDADEHKLTIAQLREKLKTDLDVEDPKSCRGLTHQEARARLARDGPNAMTPPKKTPEIVKFLLQFTEPLIVLLMLAGALSWLAYGLDKTVRVNMYCGIALFAIVFLQCLASYLEERKSAGVMDSLKQMMPAQCSVIREGQLKRIACAELVVGDVVQLKGGDRVPADVRILQTSGLKVESSSLTGEPDAFEMKVNATHEEPHESRNLCFNTSRCTEGSAVAVVYRTADRTLIGMVAALTTDTGGNISTLQREIRRVVWFIVLLAMAMAIAILIIGILNHFKGVIITNLVITAFVANIPQGLPATVTSCLGIAAKRMYKRSVLVKNLEVIETLGSATCICSDKTGTLTQNRMSVQNFWFNGGLEMLHGDVILGAAASGGEPASKDLVRWTANPLEPLLAIACVCNSAKFAAVEVGEPVAEVPSLLPPVLPLESDRQQSNKPGPPPPVEDPEELNEVPLAMTREVSWASTLTVSEVIPYFLEEDDDADSSRAAPQVPLKKDARKAAPPKSKKKEKTAAEPPPSAGGKRATLPPPPPKEVAQGPRVVVPFAPSSAEILGDASETALLRYCEAVYPAEQVRDMYKQVYNQPFNSTVKYALCVVAPPGKAAAPPHYLVFLKGAPEVVLERCDRWLCGGAERPIDAEFKAHFQEAYEKFANGGERVLGFARSTMGVCPANKLTPETVPNSRFVFVGLASLMDPPKVGVDRAVQECRVAGIRTFMVTGDHALTAEAIARQVNIITKPTRNDLAARRGVPVAKVDPRDPEIRAVVMTGTELKKLSEQDWQWLMDQEELVFARTTPQQKLEIVENLQARGEIVAVTGDGVNDAPALKKANIGVAMGNPNASDVAREASDIIILDDDFCSIVNAIREGRLLFDNLKKSIAYTLTHLLPEMVPVFANICFSFPLGLSPMLILTIDLGSELVPAIALAYEEPENAIMQRRPRNIKTDRMVTLPLLMHSYLFVGIMESVAAMAAYTWVFWDHGVHAQHLYQIDESYFTEDAAELESGGSIFDAKAQVDILSIANGAVYANIILCQMCHVWFCRTRTTSVLRHAPLSNKGVLLAMPWELAFIFIFCYISPMREVFVSGNQLPFKFWLPAAAFLVWLFVHTETLKFFARQELKSGAKNLVARLAW